MNIYTLKNIALIVIIGFIIVASSVAYKMLSGDVITEEQAISICAGLVDENIDGKFKVTRYDYKDTGFSTEVKVSLFKTFSNGRKTSSDCIIRRRNKDQILLKQAFIVNQNGTLAIFENIYYTKKDQ